MQVMLNTIHPLFHVISHTGHLLRHVLSPPLQTIELLEFPIRLGKAKEKVLQGQKTSRTQQSHPILP